MKPVKSPRVGAVRPSQLMFSHGVGALVDLPNFSAVVAGLDDWDTTHQQTLVERRLLAAVQQMPNMAQVEALRTAPWLEETRNPFDDWARVGVPVVPFPRWMRCTGCNLLIPIDSGLLDLKHEPYRPDRTRFVHNCRSDGKPPLAVPARFVTACADGHLDEFPWIEFCHYKQPCSGKPQVRLNEIGGSRSTDVQLECVTCGQKMHLSQAFGEPGRRTMPQMPRATSAPQAVRAVRLHAPAPRGAARRVERLVSRDEVGAVAAGRARPDRAARREALDRSRRGPVARRARCSRQVLACSQGVRRARSRSRVDARRAATPGRDRRCRARSISSDPSGRCFRIRARRRCPTTSVSASRPCPRASAGLLERTVLVERLRVVTAMCGFTRIDGPDSGVAGDERGGAVRATGARAAQMGSGRGGTRRRCLRPAVGGRRRRVGSARRGLRRASRRCVAVTSAGGSVADSILRSAGMGARYVLLHSLAHALATELALECGYSPASVQERIYAREPGGT